MKIVTADQMRRIEQRSVEAGVSTDMLMENAGLEFARRVRHHLGRVVGASILVLVGPGNNGGDGLVAARHLHAWGARTSVYLCRDRPPNDPKLALAQARGMPVMPASEDSELAQLQRALAPADLVVDAVLGTGRSRPIEGLLREILLRLARVKAARPDLRIISMDLPTGLDADTGAVDPVCPPVDVTVTLGYPKRGLFAFPGAERAGKVETVDIGVPDGLDGDIRLRLMTPKWAGALLPSRPISGHKGVFGKALVVAGSRNYVGAAYLAATAAYRSGAGLVTLAIPESLQMAVAGGAVETTYLPLPETSPGVPSPDASRLIVESVGGYEALLVGCGLGQAPGARELVEGLVYSGATLPPTLVDADGLNILSLSPQRRWWEKFPAAAIVTPHPGEMSRLTGMSTQDIHKDRLGLAIESAARWNKVVVLKGAFTVVAAPSGGAMLSPFANPGLATAGTGDVLAGAIVGLLAQGLSLDNAAPLGVYLHGLAGETVRNELGDAGMMAGDLLPALPRAIKGLAAGA